MAVFEVSSKTVVLAGPPKKKHRRFRQEWWSIIRFVLAVGGAGGFFAFLTRFKGSNDAIFILLPVLVYLAAVQFQRSNPKFPGFKLRMLFITPSYLLLTICLAFIYYGGIAVLEILIHPGYHTSIVFITTALTATVILDPVRVYFQQRIERRFNRRNRETAKAIAAFTSTLRTEIDLDQLRERFLAVIQKALQPYFVTLWLRASIEQPNPTGASEEVVVAGSDPLLACALSHPGTLQVEHLALASPALQDLKQRGAELLLPLASQGELIGLLILGPHLKGEDYTGEERALLDTLAPQVAPALRVSQMVQVQQVQALERERIEQELRTAQEIQHSFLPKDVPALPGWQLTSYYQPAREVGGDFYDFLTFADGRVGIMIGDVTGKGVPAALVMATVHTMLRAAVQATLAPAEVLSQVNILLAAEIPTGMFVTCFFAVLDPRSGHLRYANAGHETPFRLQHGCASELWATGMPLGLLPDTNYAEQEVTLSPGESLLFYSDGLVEAHNPSREMFGFPRLQMLLEKQADQASLLDVLLGELTRFTGERWEQEDDVTLVTLCYRLQ
jgi:serine phosphatase RsbU (regulator of sigma subunit)